MNWRRVKLLLWKDWRGIVSNRDVLLPMLVLPMLLTVVIPGVLLFAIHLPGAASELEEMAVWIGAPAGTDPALLAIRFVSEFMMKPLFLVVPTMISSIVASDSFAGEKERKTIETLLVLPATDVELVLGKILVSLLPSLAVSWVCFSAFGVVVNAAALGTSAAGAVLVFLDVSWLLEVFLLTPLLAFFSILVSTLISARARSVKAAQGYAGAVALPVFALLFLQLGNVVFLGDLATLLALCAGLASVDAILLQLGKRALNREQLVLSLD
ncbi:MAG: hypothetical protein Kow0069_27510 [Promethearchaeota archaeon]